MVSVSVFPYILWIIQSASLASQCRCHLLRPSQQSKCRQPCRTQTFLEAIVVYLPNVSGPPPKVRHRVGKQGFDFPDPFWVQLLPIFIISITVPPISPQTLSKYFPLSIPSQRCQTRKFVLGEPTPLGLHNVWLNSYHGWTMLPFYLLELTL